MIGHLFLIKNSIKSKVFHNYNTFALAPNLAKLNWR